MMTSFSSLVLSSAFGLFLKMVWRLTVDLIRPFSFGKVGTGSAGGSSVASSEERTGCGPATSTVLAAIDSSSLFFLMPQLRHGISYRQHQGASRGHSHCTFA